MENKDKLLFSNYKEYNQNNNLEDSLYKLYKNDMMGGTSGNNNKNFNNNLNNNLSQNSQRNNNNIGGGGGGLNKNNSESTIMEMTVPIKIKSDDKDDWIRDLKITMIVNFPTPSKQLIQIQLTDEKDPLFMYTLEIGEQEFHYLKQELSLLIEFQIFPQKFFEMLELCNSNSSLLQSSSNVDMNFIMNKSMSISNYVAILHHNSLNNESLLIIQEITQFRQLSHLILRFKPANDNLLKKYLSTVVKDYKNKYEIGVKENLKLNENLDLFKESNKSQQNELNTIKNNNSNEIENLKIEHNKIINEMKENFYEEIRVKLENRENEKNLQKNEFLLKIEELSKKIEILQNEKFTLEDLKIKLESQERDLIGRNSIISSELKVYKEEVENLRSQTTSLNSNNFSQEKFLTEFKIKNELLNNQLEDKEKNIFNLTQLVENLNKSKLDMEDNLKSSKIINNKLEDKLQTSINEINKGNEIIQKLQNDLKSGKEKIKMKGQAMKAQELVIINKEKNYEDLMRGLGDIKKENENKDEEIKKCKNSNENLRSKLEEAQKVLEENDKVIRFLNQKLNDSYQPFRNILGGGNNTLNKEYNMNMNLGGEKENNKNNFQNQNQNQDYMNTGSSFGKGPYFNSMAFQSQGSFNYDNKFTSNLNNKEKDNNLYREGSGNSGSNINNFNTNVNNGMIMPETNLGNYKNLSNNNVQLVEENSGKGNFSSTFNNNNNNLNKFTSTIGTTGNLNMNTNNYGNTMSSSSKNTTNNLLSHKYGNSQKSGDNNYIVNSGQSGGGQIGFSNNSNTNSNRGENYGNMNIEEEEPRQAPLSDKNIYLHKGIK